MFEDFMSGDMGAYLMLHKAANNIELIKTNFVSQVEDTQPAAMDADELHKGWDGVEPYQDYLAKRRGDSKKDIPLYKMINTDIPEAQEVKTPLDSVFSNFEEGKEVNLSNILHKSQLDHYQETDASALWNVERENEQLKKNLEVLAPLYKELVLDAKEVTEDSLTKSLQEKGYGEEASKTIAAVLLKACSSKAKMDEKASEKSEEPEEALEKSSGENVVEETPSQPFKTGFIRKFAEEE